MTEKRTTGSILRDGEAGALERSEAAKQMATKKHRKVGRRARRRQCAEAARAQWEDVSPLKRSAEMRRRRRLGIARKKRRLAEVRGGLPTLQSDDEGDVDAHD